MTACSAVEPAIDESIGPATRREAEAVGAKEQLEKFVAIKRGKRGKPPAGLVANWNFDERPGTLSAFSSPNHDTAILSTRGASFSTDVHP